MFSILISLKTHVVLDIEGCSISPLLFNLFLNDIVLIFKATGKGVKLDNKTVCILLYADDILFLTENKSDMQLLLDTLSSWCKSNFMAFNPLKNNKVHFLDLCQ